MKRMQAFKYRLNVPYKETATELSQMVGCTRFVWNKGLELSKQRYPGYSNLSKLLPEWKKEYPWLKDVDSICLQQSLRHLDRAWRNFFKKAGHWERPRNKVRGRHDAFKIVGAAAAKTEQNRVWIPKVGWLSFRPSRPWRGFVKSYVVSRVANKWEVSLQCEVEVEEPQAREDAWIGIDVGVAQYATLSDGTVYNAIHPLKRQLLRLKRLQRKLARKKDKTSHRRHKLKIRIARLHHHIANMRKNHAHQASASIVKKHGHVRVEDLKLQNMMKSAKGTVENPGKQVAQKSGLNRS